MQIFNNIEVEDMILSESSPLWKDFKNYLKQKRKEMTVEDVLVDYIEENKRTADYKTLFDTWKQMLIWLKILSLKVNTESILARLKTERENDAK